MKRNVTITSVTDNAVIPKKDGGSYTGLLITGTSNGKPYTRGIHPTGLTKYPGLKEKLLGLRSGDTVAFVQEDGGFKNITDVTTDLSQDTSSYNKGGGFKSKRGGMNLNDTARIARSTAVQAAAQLGTAKTTAELLTQAEDIATFIMSPLSVDSSGNSVTTSKQETADAFEEDTPF